MSNSDAKPMYQWSNRRNNSIGNSSTSYWANQGTVVFLEKKRQIADFRSDSSSYFASKAEYQLKSIVLEGKLPGCHGLSSTIPQLRYGVMELRHRSNYMSSENHAQTPVWLWKNTTSQRDYEVSLFYCFADTNILSLIKSFVAQLRHQSPWTKLAKIKLCRKRHSWFACFKNVHPNSNKKKWKILCFYAGTAVRSKA